jgi:hypothetical protein
MIHPAGMSTRPCVPAAAELLAAQLLLLLLLSMAADMLLLCCPLVFPAAAAVEVMLTSFTEMIWPLAFFTRRSLRRKYLPVWVETAVTAAASAAAWCLASMIPVTHAPSSRLCRSILAELNLDSPELALGFDGIRRPHLHAVHGGVGIVLGGQVAPHHLVLVEVELLHINHRHL